MKVKRSFHTPLNSWNYAIEFSSSCIGLPLISRIVVGNYQLRSVGALYDESSTVMCSYLMCKVAKNGSIPLV